MGFSWSSMVAQSQMSSTVAGAGWDKHMVLADDLPAPCDLSSVVSVATGDVMHFSSRGRELSERCADRLIEGFRAAGVVRVAF